MNAGDLILEALNLLEDGGWQKGSFASGADGGPAYVHSEEAVSYCALGALYRASQIYDGTHLHCHAVQAIKKQIGWESIPTWNDAPERKFEQVREAFRRAAFTAGAAMTEESSLVAVGSA